MFTYNYCLPIKPFLLEFGMVIWSGGTQIIQQPVRCANEKEIVYYFIKSFKNGLCYKN